MDKDYQREMVTYTSRIHGELIGYGVDTCNGNPF